MKEHVYQLYKKVFESKEVQELEDQDAREFTCLVLAGVISVIARNIGPVKTNLLIDEIKRELNFEEAEQIKHKKRAKHSVDRRVKH